MLGFSELSIADQTKYEHFLKEAETDRLIKQMKAASPQKHNQLLSACGDLLIAAGQRLKAEEGPKAAPSGKLVLGAKR